MAVAMYYLGHYFYQLFDMHRFLGVLAQTAITISCGILLFLLITYLLGCEELIWAIKRRVNGGQSPKTEK
jgi:hypothetical protein